MRPDGPRRTSRSAGGAGREFGCERSVDRDRVRRTASRPSVKHLVVNAGAGFRTSPFPRD
jgi:hypothetical protein